jgi:hypothetical protein
MMVTRFFQLKDGERVLRVIRGFLLRETWRFALAFALIAAPMFFMVPLFSLRLFGLITFGVSVVAGMLYMLRSVLLWYWNAFVITTHRIVDIDQRGLFDRVVSEAVYDKIQDVSHRRRGVIGTVLNYGSIIIQTAGSAANLEMAGVRDPKEVHHLITETMAAYAEIGQTTRRGAEFAEAASRMSDAEARAFLTQLNGAMQRREDSIDKEDDLGDSRTRGA